MTDVLIIGAGPSGSVAAALLAQAGFSVQVLEAQKFPRFSIGESLLAQSLDLIERSGMLPAVQIAGFQYKNGAAFRQGERYAEYNFADKSSPGPGYTYQVPRAEFDLLLIQQAQRMGAQVEFEVAVIAADFSDSQPRIQTRDAHGALKEHRPRFVLDASGFGRSLPRLLKLETPSDFPVRGALFTQVHDNIAAGRFDRQKILISVHPTLRDVWYWLIPFSDGRASIGVVGSPDYLDALPGDATEKLFEAHRQTPELAELIGQPELVFPARELRGYAANVRTMHGPGFALLGNAAEFLDPVFSSGVTIAMKSAHLASDALHKQLHGKPVNWATEFEAPLRLGVETFRNFVDSWYCGDLQDIFFYTEQDPQVRRYICSILAGYAWDNSNPYVGQAGRQRLAGLAKLCRTRKLEPASV